MLHFILNDKEVQPDLKSGSTVLDYVRYNKRLTGTKIGCREGDCGACTVLVGDFENGKLVYRSMTSCLMPLGNAHGKHIVSIEGINMNQLSPVQKAMVETNGTQCGFCTPGFVMSLTGFVMNQNRGNCQDAIASIDGNICRCTGYKSIEKAACKIVDQITEKPSGKSIPWLIDHGFLPEYFQNIESRLTILRTKVSIASTDQNKNLVVGGGTDLIVQKHHQVKQADVNHVFDNEELKRIYENNGRCHIGASVTVTQFSESEIIKSAFPNLQKFIKLVSSTPIRNMATIAGNLVNASPIGDMTVFLLALDAEVILDNNGNKRSVKLNQFYKDYKNIDKTADEIITEINFKLPQKNDFFNFEKVCKRTHLDIASVNSACFIKLNTESVIEEIHLSAGGV
ncbi:MAG: FAD binding domain-containing protein, partial [Saprospiraceae bacterium]